MGWVVFFTVTDFSLPPGFVCSFCCSGPVLSPLVSCSGVTQILRTGCSPSQNPASVCNQFKTTYLRFTCPKNMQGLTVFIYRAWKKEKKQRSTEENPADTGTHNIVPVWLKAFPERWNWSRVKVTVWLLSDADLACSAAIPGHISPGCLATASG